MGQNGGVPFVGHCVLLFVSSNEILCGLVILVCSANRLSPDLDRLAILVCSASRLRLDLNRLNPLCRWYWFSALVFQIEFRCEAEWRCVTLGALCPLVRLV